MSPAQSEKPESWHLDKKVPIGLIVALAVQFAGGAVWLSRMESRIAEAIATNIDQGAEIRTLREETQAMAVSAERVATQLEGLREGVAELKEAQRETNVLLREITKHRAAP